MCHVSSNQLSLSSVTIFSDACAIDDGEAVVLTGSQDDASMNKVMMYSMKGQAITLPSLITGRYGHACGKVTKIDGTTVNYCFPLPTIHNLLNPTLYILCSCTLWRVVSTVTVRPEKRSPWHPPRFWRRAGDNPGRKRPVCLILKYVFCVECLLRMVTSWCQVRNCDASYWTMFQYLLLQGDRIEEERLFLGFWTMILMQTSGLEWAIWPRPATTTAWASCPRRLLTTASDVFKQRSV